MPVNLTAPDPAALLPVRGVALGTAAAGIRKADRSDLLIIALDAGARVSAIFTQNRFCAAPVIVAREHLKNDVAVRALLINTGNANAGTGAQGIDNARRSCAELARLLGCAPTQVLPFSTGVIMEPLPIERVTAGLPACVADLRPGNWFAAAQAIMTTDTMPKALSRCVDVGDARLTITGIAKGAGMIRPDMATMLGFVATDARISEKMMDRLVREVADQSFNCITVDGDTSTNDAFLLIASGKAAMDEIQDADSAEYLTLRDALAAVAVSLSQAIVRDGEGATKFITICVERGASRDECRKVCYAIAHSPLVKTAFFASDPNLGRILAAIGYAGIVDLDVSQLEFYLDDIAVVARGARHPDYREINGQKVMAQSEITIRVALNRGVAQSTVWTCDLSYDYIKINADYRS